eukprot:6174403-Pleurochrysis_carterae.AAC.4
MGGSERDLNATNRSLSHLAALRMRQLLIACPAIGLVCQRVLHTCVMRLLSIAWKEFRGRTQADGSAWVKSTCINRTQRVRRSACTLSLVAGAGNSWISRFTVLTRLGYL